MPNYTTAQLEAIRTSDRNLHIVACAGSGKTQVIAERVVRLLESADVDPANIVAFTFTEKAAAELETRILDLARTRLGDVVGLAEMFVGTMHAYCLNLLQEHLFEYLKYSVLTDIQTFLLVDRNSRRSGLTSTSVKVGPSAGTPLTRYRDTATYLQALNILREDELLDDPPEDLQEGLSAYRDLLRQHRYLDFSEILAAAVAAIESTSPKSRPLREYLRHVTRYVIVDEYQDVNPIQERLVAALSGLGANVCVVGDDDQTIYQWRGSDVDQILTFADRYPEVVTVTLDDNFRSSAGVVAIGQAVAEGNDPNRLSKSMVASGHQSFERGDLLALEFQDAIDEARWIVDRIVEMRGFPFYDTPESPVRGLDWSDFAVLFRSVRKSAEPLVAELDRRGIPYIVAGMANLFDTSEAWACVALFEYVAGQFGRDDVVEAWLNARVGLTEADLSRGLVILDEARDWSPGERWSAYNLQRTFMDFLEAVRLREERVPPSPSGEARGEVVMYNLGRFSQAISDFEQIHFQSEPARKYESFTGWLEHAAPNYYEEGGQSAGYAQPNAVTLSTVHQAKGRQWPAVFVPALQRNRFPATGGGGRTVWHLMPDTIIRNSNRYRGSEADERRLFYVAVTRSQKFLACTWAPGGTRRSANPSPFFLEVTRLPPVLTRHVPASFLPLEPRPKLETPEVVLSFSELKYFFECPYQFKLRFLYGFNAPIHEALGYGKSVHDAMAEVHRRAQAGDMVGPEDAETIVGRHLHVPFAYPTLKDALRESAVGAVQRYLRENRENLARTEHVEKVIQVTVAPGVTVNGRIDLIRHLDTEELSIVDFKSTERAQDEEVTRDQLHVYALGYYELTGTSADLIEVLNLDPGGRSTRELVDGSLLASTASRIESAGDALRYNDLPRLETWAHTCDRCDLSGICRTKPKS